MYYFWFSYHMISDAVTFFYIVFGHSGIVEEKNIKQIYLSSTSMVGLLLSMIYLRKKTTNKRQFLFQCIYVNIIKERNSLMPSNCFKFLARNQIICSTFSICFHKVMNWTVTSLWCCLTSSKKPLSRFAAPASFVESCCWTHRPRCID